MDAALDVAADGTPEKEAERNSDLARLSTLTKDLPDRERELIALKYGAAFPA
jgi:DNA-directed RNA polymerase specialized sigma24 family protein